MSKSLLVFLVLFLIGGSAFAVESISQSDGSAAPPPNEPQGDSSTNIDVLELVPMITSNPSTWPSGDKIWDVARAIAMAEGANIAGSNPDRLNNPGDISDGERTFGEEFHTGSDITHFPDKQTGWQWLYNKLANIARGGSSVYSPDLTWVQFAQKWAGNWQSWVRNVTQQLGVDENSTFSDYVNS